MYEKVLVLQVFSKSRSSFVKKHWLIRQNGVKCMKKYWFYRYPVKVGQVFVQVNGNTTTTTQQHNNTTNNQ